MRIIHFSDFHLKYEQLDRVQEIVNRMMEALSKINTEKSIDLILFSGDMIDCAGNGFPEPKIENAFMAFSEIVIERMMKELGLPKNRFVFTIGNHEVNREVVSKNDDKKLTKKLKDINILDKHIKDPNFVEPRIVEYNKIRDNYWNDNKGDATVELSNLRLSLKMDIDGFPVGINCLNTAWRCYKSETDEHKILLGKSQITDARDFLKDCALKFAIGHHHPSMMNVFEQKTLMNLLTGNYDAFFCGHTHDNDSEYVERQHGGCFFFTSPGTLPSNIGIEGKYQNGFMVIDYEYVKDGYVNAQIYYLDDNNDFRRDNNYGDNGIWHKDLGGSNVIKPMDKSLLFQKRDSDFQYNGVIESCFEKLRDNSKKTILLTALSGLGKTRILHEAFDDGRKHDNYYYCEFSSSKEGLLNDIEEIIKNSVNDDGLIVLDNCTDEIFEDAIRIRDKCNHSFRIIAVNNKVFDIKYNAKNYFNREIEVIMLEPEQMNDMVNSYIDNEIPLINGDSAVRDSIKKIADGFIGMAIILIKQYRRDNAVDIHSVDHIVKRLLSRWIEDECQMTVLKSLALFQPFPYLYNDKKAYRFIRESERITPLYGISSNEQKRHLFSRTIKLLEGTFVEISESWLNVRPFPLAVWLVEKWFEDDDDEERIVGIIEEINALEEPIREVISEGLCKRLEYMQDSPAAQDLIYRLTNKDGSIAPFCNEKVVCSDLGSRLFLAMTTVNPGAVASCLWAVLRPKSADWVMRNIEKDVRRNLMWALEKLCFSRDSYHDGVKVMAKLALAENEDLGNNATRQLKQLFHIVLPGTEASLNDRLETLRYLSDCGEMYNDLFLDCLDSALYNGSFHRSGSGDKFGLDEKKDYTPVNNGEIVRYWEACRDLLMDRIDKSGATLDRAAKLVENHVMRWAFDGMLASMFPLIELIEQKKEDDWENLYDSLFKIKRERIQFYQPQFLDSFDALKQRIRPNTFCRKLKDVRHEASRDSLKKFEERVEYQKNRCRSLAKEFIDGGYYSSLDEIRHIVYDKDYYDLWFSWALSQTMQDAELKVLLDIFLKLITDGEGDEFNSNFVFKICYVFRDREPMKNFTDSLYTGGLKLLYVRMLAYCENEQFSSYLRIKEDICKGRLSKDAATLYLQCVSLNTIEQIVTFLIKYSADYQGNPVLLVQFILRYRYDSELLANGEVMKVIKQILLDYPIEDGCNNPNYDYTDFVVTILEEYHDAEFAIAINKKMIDGLSRCFIHGDFEDIYRILLRDYKDAIWDDFETALACKDKYFFFYQIKNEIGSGSGFGKGSLFIDNDERIKEMCRKYPQRIPPLIADTAPIFHYESDNTVSRFHDWVLWLLDEYGDNKNVLDGLHGNMESYGWTGSVIPLMMQKKRCFEQLKSHHRPEVRRWAEICIKALDEELKRESDKEEYMRLRYN
ncbi:MAG: metallophosphoesterase [Prevotellaceae bacterium]|nr:metallophosphoesterase [Prevotellaceae bacterium]